jgi:hypothetical protein
MTHLRVVIERFYEQIWLVQLFLMIISTVGIFTLEMIYDLKWIVRLGTIVMLLVVFGILMLLLEYQSPWFLLLYSFYITLFTFFIVRETFIKR